MWIYCAAASAGLWSSVNVSLWFSLKFVPFWAAFTFVTVALTQLDDVGISNYLQKHISYQITQRELWKYDLGQDNVLVSSVVLQDRPRNVAKAKYGKFEVGQKECKRKVFIAWLKEMRCARGEEESLMEWETEEDQAARNGGIMRGGED